ncbi:hypothetical protein EBZ39_09400, partial [bacterium]|nr:hypothetical protein [bacterium]
MKFLALIFSLMMVCVFEANAQMSNFNYGQTNLSGSGANVGNVVHNNSYISGRWYMPLYNGGTGSGSTATWVSNTLYFIPMTVDSPVTIGSLGIRTVTGQAGSGIFTAIYDVDPATCNPTNLIVSATGILPTVGTNADTAVSLTSLFTPVVGKHYVIAALVSSSALPPTILGYSQQEIFTQQTNKCGFTSPNITTGTSAIL